MLGIRESRTPSIRLIFHKIERERGEEFYLNFIRFNLRLVKVVISLLTVQEQERKKYQKGSHLKQKQNKELLLRWSI